jgi:3-methyladenine DNA glycosylase AlkD
MTAPQKNRRIVKTIKKELLSCGSEKKAKVLKRFFKTGPKEYAEGDKFIGAQVPDIRKIACKHADLAQEAIISLLASPIHEERLLALLIWVAQFEKAGERGKKEIFRLYLKNAGQINNWDLVDLSAHQIVGAFLLREKNKQALYRLAGSGVIWERRIAIIATFNFIKHGDFEDTFKIAGILLADKEDLIHKAAGWMLREIGKRDQAKEERFLKRFALKMPRTMLRYAIERFSRKKRDYYLALPKKKTRKKTCA